MKSGVRISSTDLTNQSLYIVYIPAYLFGAQKQIQRYQDAVKLMRTSTLEGLYMVMHETSSLLEDLDCLKKYMKLSGISSKGYKYVWTEARRHIRHDLREDLGSSNSFTTNRAKAFGIRDNLLVEMSFDEEAIHIGSTLVKVAEIENFLAEAGKATHQRFEEMVKAGRISHNPLSFV